jgi:Helix-turn-helix domain
MEENQRNGLLTTSEVATRLRVNPSAVPRWRLDDVGPRYLRVGGIYRSPAGDLEEWISESVRHSIAS